ncbi:hypothetical protein B0F90DRAFT_1716316 [Multifurca ochricompacta]|uniref:Uncharacterized protein n=1 Tax=Multifurca ochricompacta TaxID=376703 RepID=A0AAD4M763_9AGAM|nr:hypothetical protein B0F90DRAFT_1716316 [Multifurca ochricompacta]
MRRHRRREPLWTQGKPNLVVTFSPRLRDRISRAIASSTHHLLKKTNRRLSAQSASPRPMSLPQYTMRRRRRRL